PEQEACRGKGLPIAAIKHHQVHSRSLEWPALLENIKPGLRCYACSHSAGQETAMSGNLDWKWIGFGVLIMLGLSLVAGVVMGLALGRDLQGASQGEDIELRGGQGAALAIGEFLVVVIGGLLVGLKSGGRTILEPGICAAIAVVIALVL